jgi:hypothetical protein
LSGRICSPLLIGLVDLQDALIESIAINVRIKPRDAARGSSVINASLAPFFGRSTGREHHYHASDRRNTRHFFLPELAARRGSGG